MWQVNPKRVSDRGSSQIPLYLGVSLSLFGTLLVSFCSGSAAAQSCLGLSPDPNSAGFEAGIENQADGHRLGVWVNVNVAGRIGILGGASGGTLDPFATGGSEARGLFSIGLGPRFSRGCVFAEYEQEDESFREWFDLDRGKYQERWTRLGFAVTGNLWSLAGAQMAWHAAPELILREFRLKGRRTYWDPEIYVLETTRGKASTHLGGRALISLRTNRLFVVLSLKNRPRVSSDIHWGFHLGFPI